MLLLLVLPGAVRAQVIRSKVNGAITIADCPGPGGAIVIPATMDDLPVTSIDSVPVP